jgi:hypothetical protein
LSAARCALFESQPIAGKTPAPALRLILKPARSLQKPPVVVGLGVHQHAPQGGDTLDFHQPLVVLVFRIGVGVVVEPDDLVVVFQAADDLGRARPTADVQQQFRLH